MTKNALSPETVASRTLLPVLAVAAATFLVVTSEMMPVGVLSPMAESLGVSTGLAGMSLTITGVIAAIVCTLAPVLARGVDRRTILAGFMLLLAAANAITALATSYAALAGARALLGVAMGMVWGLAAGLGARLSTGRGAALATTIIFSGVSLASVVGVPLGTLVADRFGWRTAFWALAVLGLATSALLLTLVPRLPAAGTASLAGVFGVLRNPGVSIGLSITGLVVFGHFTGYTYVRPVLEGGFGLPAALIAAALLVYGLAGVVGNVWLGPIAVRDPKRGVLAAIGGVFLATTLLAAGVAASPAAAFLLLAIWGLGYGGVSVATQSWTASAEPARVEASSALWSGVFNASIALGSVTGGLALEAGGSGQVLWLAAGITALAAGLAALARPTRRPAGPRERLSACPSRRASDRGRAGRSGSGCLPEPGHELGHEGVLRVGVSGERHQGGRREPVDGHEGDIGP